MLVQCCEMLQSAFEEFHNFRKSTTLKDSIIEVNRLEEEGDAIYRMAIRDLYSDPSDPIELITWTTIFDLLEGCCDACEDVANIMESVMMKNS